MVSVSFTENLQRHVACGPIEVSEGLLADVLDQVFATYPALKDYVLTEQGDLRQHVMLAIDQQLVQGALPKRQRLNSGSRLHIMQALSGG